MIPKFTKFFTFLFHLILSIISASLNALKSDFLLYFFHSSKLPSFSPWHNLYMFKADFIASSIVSVSGYKLTFHKISSNPKGKDFIGLLNNLLSFGLSSNPYILQIYFPFFCFIPCITTSFGIVSSFISTDDKTTLLFIFAEE